jgi:hypothetical protein
MQINFLKAQLRLDADVSELTGFATEKHGEMVCSNFLQLIFYHLDRTVFPCAILSTGDSSYQRSSIVATGAW